MTENIVSVASYTRLDSVLKHNIKVAIEQCVDTTGVKQFVLLAHLM